MDNRPTYVRRDSGAFLGAVDDRVDAAVVIAHAVQAFVHIVLSNVTVAYGIVQVAATFALVILLDISAVHRFVT